MNTFAVDRSISIDYVRDENKKPVRFETGYVKYMTINENNLFFDHLYNLDSPPMIMLIETKGLMGMRRGDVCCMIEESFSKDLKKYYFTEEKTGKVREKVVPEVLRQKLIRYLKRYRHRLKKGFCGCHKQCKEGTFIFFSSWRNQSKYLHIRKDSVSVKVRELCDKAGLDDVYHIDSLGKKWHRITAHTLRHFFTWKIYKASGNDIVLTKQIVGHSKLETTFGYIASVEAKLREEEIVNKAFK